MPSSQPVGGHLAVLPEFMDSQPSPMAKTSEPNRNTKYDPKKVHITELPITKSNWYKHVNWLNVIFIIGVPLYGCVQAAWTPLRLYTALWAVAYYFATGLGITAGYHRLWAHTSRIARSSSLTHIAISSAPLRVRKLQSDSVASASASIVFEQSGIR